MTTAINERLMEKDQEEDQETSGLEISKSGLRRRPMTAPKTLWIATCGVSLQVNGGRGDDTPR